MQWRTGDEVRVTVEDVPGTHDRVSTTYAGLARDARRRLGLFLPGMNVSLPVLSAKDITASRQSTEGHTQSAPPPTSSPYSLSMRPGARRGVIPNTF